MSTRLIVVSPLCKRPVCRHLGVTTLQLGVTTLQQATDFDCFEESVFFFAVIPPCFLWHHFKLDMAPPVSALSLFRSLSLSLALPILLFFFTLSVCLFVSLRSLRFSSSLPPSLPPSLSPSLSLSLRPCPPLCLSHSSKWHPCLDQNLDRNTAANEQELNSFYLQFSIYMICWLSALLLRFESCTNIYNIWIDIKEIYTYMYTNIYIIVSSERWQRGVVSCVYMYVGTFI